MIEFMRSIYKMNIFIFDYSGYGLSRGRPGEQQLYKDGQVINFTKLNLTFEPSFCRLLEMVPTSGFQMSGCRNFQNCSVLLSIDLRESLF